MSDLSTPEENAPAEVAQASSQRGFALPEPIAHRQGLFGAGTDSSTSGFAGLVTDSFLPGEASRPYGGWFDQVVDVLEELIAADGLRFPTSLRKSPSTAASSASSSPASTSRASPSTCATTPTCASSCVWGPTARTTPSIRVASCTPSTPLYSITYNRMIRLEVTCPDEDPRIPSIVSVYPGNDWQERETWDLIGIVFTGHPSLTRTAMPDDWIGHPQRKDYPLGGIPVESRAPSTLRRCS